MRTIEITKNPFLIFLPFLMLFVLLILIFHTNGNYGDEFQYRLYANNLIHGFYSPSPPNIDLSVGPGYPIILIPFVALSLPLISIALINAIFYYLSIILLFKALSIIISFRRALVFSIFWACSYYSYKEMYSMQPETFTSFLITLLIYYLLKTFYPDYNLVSKKYIYISGLIFGYLVLTKIIFGYVLVFMLIGNLLLWFLRRKAINYRKGLFVLLIAFAVTIPYLIYTYNLTGRILFFGTSGGNNLYWMSTPYDNEYGDWVGYDYLYINSLKKNRIPNTYDSLKAHHEKDFEEISKYVGIEKDNAFKRIAIKNIKSHPFKFIKNCFSNIGRMFFDLPYSYSLQRYNNLFKLPYNGIIVVLILICIIPTLINWRKILFPIRFLLLTAFLYLGGSILGSAEMRMFVKIIPIMLIWIAFVIQKCITVKLKFSKT